ncbi:MAG TPA: FprA family A-type flavoprotein [Anaerolineae bacterium]|nr:FprA family A-type flavoprotein [Anaerolineae bacterium]
MPPVPIRPNVYWIGVNDRTTDLFEGLWPITQEGVSYNTYLIDDEKKAIVDLVKAIKTDEFFGQIEQIIDLSELDYVILNHMEPDHTGVARTIRRLAPEAKFLCSKRAQDMLSAFYGITENVQVVNDGDSVDLGAHTLRFYSTPMVHWPETMMTYEVEDQILFSCDAFGGYGALRGALFDDQCTDKAWYEREALRYYVNIVALFSRPVLRAIAKLADLPISTIAPSHGLIWRDNPLRIVELYQKWAEYATGPGEVGVTLVYGSMYGNTEGMMNAVAQGISDEDVPVSIFDAAHAHASYILPAMWTQRGVMVGAPTYEGSLFPPVEQLLEMASHKKISNKLVARFGSYGWSGGAQRRFNQLVEEMGWSALEEFEFAGGATQADLEHGKAFGAAFARAVRSAGS